MDNSPPTDPSGEVKRPRNDLYSDILTGYQNPYHVELVDEFRKTMSIHPDPGRLGQRSTLALVDGLDRCAECLASPSLHLDEGDLRVTLHDEIDIAVSAAEPVCHQRPSVPTVPAGRYPLAQQSELLPCHRHGTTIGASPLRRRTETPVVLSERRRGRDGPVPEEASGIIRDDAIHSDPPQSIGLGGRVDRPHVRDHPPWAHRADERTNGHRNPAMSGWNAECPEPGWWRRTAQQGARDKACHVRCAGAEGYGV